MMFATGFGTECRILTANGRKPVGDVVEGDLLIGFASVPLANVSLLSRRGQTPGGDPRVTFPVLVAANALREGVPDRDTLLSPNTAVVVSSGPDGIVACPVRGLVHGSTIQHVTGPTEPLVTIATSPADLIDVNGLLCLPALELKGFDLIEVPDALALQALWRSRGLDIRFASEASVATLREQIHARALEMGWTRIVLPDLRVRTHRGDLKVRAAAGGKYTFMLPAGVNAFELHAPSGMIFEIGPWHDDLRVLSVIVGEMHVDGVRHAADDPAFGAGFYGVERSGENCWRWMSGTGAIRLPPALVDRLVTFNVAEGAATPKFAPSGVQGAAPAGGRPSEPVPALVPIRTAAFARHFLPALKRAATLEDLSQLRGEAMRAVEEAVRERDFGAADALSARLFKGPSLQLSRCVDVADDLAKPAVRLLHDLHVHAAVAMQVLHDPTATDAMVARVEQQIGALAPQPGRPVVCVFLTIEYLANFEIWLQVFARQDAAALNLVVCVFTPDVGAAVARLAGDVGVRAAVLNIGIGDRAEYHLLWFIKVSIIRAALRHGSDVIYSDLDCYWVGDAVRLFASADLRPYDLCFMASTDMPLVGLQAWGFVPCAGFVRVAATPGATRFVARWHALTRVLGDDQIAVTELLLSQHAAWQPTGNATVSHATGHHDGEGTQAVLGLLSDRVAHRAGAVTVDDIAERVLWHPRWVHDPESHRDMLKTGVLNPAS